MFNVHDSNTLDIFTSLFAYDSLIHQHNTRQSVHFHVSLVKGTSIKQVKVIEQLCPNGPEAARETG